MEDEPLAIALGVAMVAVCIVGGVIFLIIWYRTVFRLRKNKGAAVNPPDSPASTSSIEVQELSRKPQLEKEGSMTSVRDCSANLPPASAPASADGENSCQGSKAPDEENQIMQPIVPPQQPPELEQVSSSEIGPSSPLVLVTKELPPDPTPEPRPASACTCPGSAPGSFISASGRRRRSYQPYATGASSGAAPPSPMGSSVGSSATSSAHRTSLSGADKDRELARLQLEVHQLRTALASRRRTSSRSDLPAREETPEEQEQRLQREKEAMARALNTTGVVRVMLHSGSGLKAMDDTTHDGEMDNSDPYCQIELGGVVQRSQAVKKSLNPVWQQTLTYRGEAETDEDDYERMTLREMIEKGMRIQCLDMDKKFGFDGLCKNELLGEAQVDLSALLTKRAVKLKAPLNTQGVITLTVSWDGEDPDGQPIDELAEAAAERAKMTSAERFRLAEAAVGVAHYKKPIDPSLRKDKRSHALGVLRS